MGICSRHSAVVLCLFALGLFGCATSGYRSTVRDIEPDSTGEIRTTGVETPDILSCAHELASDLLSVREVAGATPHCRMALREVKNLSTFRFDAEIIANELRHKLIRHSGGRIRFVERTRGGDFAEFDSAVLGEREMKKAGIVDSGKKKDLAGVDFFLSGEIRSHSLVTARGRDDTTFFYFILQDAETGEIVWEDSYGPIRKYLGRGVAYP